MSRKQPSSPPRGRTPLSSTPLLRTVLTRRAAESSPVSTMGLRSSRSNALAASPKSQTSQFTKSLQISGVSRAGSGSEDWSASRLVGSMTAGSDTPRRNRALKRRLTLNRGQETADSLDDDRAGTRGDDDDDSLAVDTTVSSVPAAAAAAKSRLTGRAALRAVNGRFVGAERSRETTSQTKGSSQFTHGSSTASGLDAEASSLIEKTDPDNANLRRAATALKRKKPSAMRRKVPLDDEDASATNSESERGSEIGGDAARKGALRRRKRRKSESLPGEDGSKRFDDDPGVRRSSSSLRRKTVTADSSNRDREDAERSRVFSEANELATTRRSSSRRMAAASDDRMLAADGPLDMAAASDDRIIADGSLAGASNSGGAFPIQSATDVSNFHPNVESTRLGGDDDAQSVPSALSARGGDVEQSSSNRTPRMASVSLAAAAAAAGRSTRPSGTDDPKGRSPMTWAEIRARMVEMGLPWYDDAEIEEFRLNRTRESKEIVRPAADQAIGRKKRGLGSKRSRRRDEAAAICGLPPDEIMFQFLRFLGDEVPVAEKECRPLILDACREFCDLMFSKLKEIVGDEEDSLHLAHVKRLALDLGLVVGAGNLSLNVAMMEVLDSEDAQKIVPMKILDGTVEGSTTLPMGLWDWLPNCSSSSRRSGYGERASSRDISAKRVKKNYGRRSSEGRGKSAKSGSKKSHVAADGVLPEGRPNPMSSEFDRVRLQGKKGSLHSRKP